MKKTNRCYVIGHKNPDTDSVCSAIGYSYLKNQISEGIYEPARAGSLNEETVFVLNYFGFEAPLFLEDAGTQVKEIDIHETEPVTEDISVKKAWEKMGSTGAATLPVADEARRLKGIISVKDIANAYMDDSGSEALSKASPTYKSIAETLDGIILSGDERGCFDQGNVRIGAFGTDLMETVISENDLVITGNRTEELLSLIEMNASCIVVGLAAKIAPEVIEAAKKTGCTVITSVYDTYKIAKLINQSMPVKHLMISENIVTFTKDDKVDDVNEISSKTRFREYPVLDSKGRYEGMISRRELIGCPKKKIIMVDHNEKSQAVDNIADAEILEIIDHHKLGSLETVSPVLFRNHPVGCTATIIYNMFRENHVEIPERIAGLLCSAILSDTLIFRSPTCTGADIAAAEALAALAGIDDMEKYAQTMFRAGSNLKNKTTKEIFYQDFKTFNAGDIDFGVGQVNLMSAEDVADVKARLMPELMDECRENRLDMVFLMLTNILDESSEVIFFGKGADAALENAFGKEAKDGSCLLDNVVSRKKQLIPPLIGALQQM